MRFATEFVDTPLEEIDNGISVEPVFVDSDGVDTEGP